MAGVALDLQREELAIEDLQPFAHVADADARFIDFGTPFVGNSHAVVDDLDHEPPFVTRDAQDDGAAFHLGRDAVPDGVLDQRLQDHAGNEHVQGLRIDLLADLQLVTPEPDHFDVEVVIDKIEFLLQGRRALVVITDGDDTFSRADINDAIDIAQRTETTIFAISTKAGLSGAVPGVEAGTTKDRGDKGLDRLCEETGGMAFFTGDMLSLERSFTKIANELRSQYLITYRPSNDHYDGSYRKVDVKLANASDKYRLRTKRGYKAIADSVTPK